MRIIEIPPLDNGAHRNQNAPLAAVPEGWAELPEGLELPESFPFVELVLDEGTERPVVKELLPGRVPEPETAPEEPPSQLDRIEAQALYTALMTDTLLEEG